MRMRGRGSNALSPTPPPLLTPLDHNANLTTAASREMLHGASLKRGLWSTQIENHERRHARTSLRSPVTARNHPQTVNLQNFATFIFRELGILRNFAPLNCESFTKLTRLRHFAMHLLANLKAPVKSCFRAFKTDITHDRVLRISVNTPTKAFCSPICFLIVCTENSIRLVV